MARAPFQVHGFPFRKNAAGSYEDPVFRRSDAGYWQVIAGGGEDTESPVEAAKRETVEEAGIPSSADLFMLGTTASVPSFHFKARHLWPKGLYVIPAYYFAVRASGVEIALSHEHTEYRWVDYDGGLGLLYRDEDKTALWELIERLLNDDLPALA
jgi:dATP pyrophosphohydrolase